MNEETKPDVFLTTWQQVPVEKKMKDLLLGSMLKYFPVSWGKKEDTGESLMSSRIISPLSIQLVFKHVHKPFLSLTYSRLI